MSENEFKILHSEVISLYQVIKHDIRLLYLYIMGYHDNINNGLNKINNKSIAEVLSKLYLLDYSLDFKYLDEELYSYLFKMLVDMKYWLNDCYIDLLYGDSTPYESNTFIKLANRLNKAFEEMELASYKLEVAKLRFEKF